MGAFSNFYKEMREINDLKNSSLSTEGKFTTLIKAEQIASEYSDNLITK